MNYNIKNKDLIKFLTAHGFYFKREGAAHEIWTNGPTIVSVPRHKGKDLNGKTVRDILRTSNLLETFKMVA